MKFSLSLALLTALFVASCSEEPPPQRAGRRAANYPPSRAEEYPPPQQPFNPNGPVQPTGTQFPSLANPISWKVRIRLANTSMWKAFLQERK